MKKSIMLVLVLVMGALLAMTACNNSESTTGAGGGVVGRPTPGSGGSTAAGGAKKVVGFVQTGTESGWRRAHTKSVREEGAKRGIEVKFTDAEGHQEAQIAAIRSYITQKVDAIILAPIVSDGWDQVLQEAKDAHVPVFLSDRSIETKNEDLYVAFVGSDFKKEGQMAGDWLAKKMDGKANIVVLVGTPGSAPAVDRGTGFKEAISKFPDMKILDEQSGDFKLDNGKTVMESLIKKYDNGKGISALFAQNDDMALGAIQAIRDAGLRPGIDIVIVSVDGLKTAFEAMVKGDLNCTVTCNPLLGPSIFDTIEKYWKGEKLDKKAYIQDKVYDQSTAAAEIGSREY